MLIPYTVDVPMERIPFTNWALIAVTSLLSIGILLKTAHEQRNSFGGAGPVMSPEAQRFWAELQKKELTPEEEDRAIEEFERRFPAEAQFETPTLPFALNPRNFSPLQLFSCVFVHGDLFHLIGNMLFLFVFGNAVNAKLGQVQYLAAYFLLGAVASLAWLLLGAGQPAVGASGAIMGIVGIFLVLFPRNDITMLYAYSIAASGSFSVSAMWIILLYLGGDLYGSLHGGGGGVAYIAHLGGALGGVAVAATAVWFGFLRPTRYEQNLLQVLGVAPSKPVKKKKRKKRPSEEVAE